MGGDYEMRDACRFGCATLLGEPWTDGDVRTVNGKEVMRCSVCGRAQ